MSQTLEEGPFGRALNELGLDLKDFRVFEPEPQPQVQLYQWRNIDPGYKDRIENLEVIKRRKLNAEDVLISNANEEEFEARVSMLVKAAGDTPYVYTPDGSIFPTVRYGDLCLFRINEYRLLGGLEHFKDVVAILRPQAYDQSQYRAYMRKVVSKTNFYLGADRSIPPYPF